ncbi:DUF6455 family protein [Pseudophaeobacter leonis]|uniref:DUF6455 family protein n=1 Tax=Pseudophaeobacter leonis TaxID=1144477 RepID=UPI0009F1F464|nr:DUF6455 family protein [Pseudophaeobacter leonis]
MRQYAILKTHAALFDDMSRAVGLDLPEEAVSGRLQFDEISEAVLRCSRCAHPTDCAAQLSGGMAEISAAPDYCRNRDLLDFLKEETV